mgnify:CR=1 FL=1
MIISPICLIHSKVKAKSDVLRLLESQLLIIDRAEKVKHGCTIIASIAGELTVKIWDEKRQLLQPANRNMQPISVSEGLEAICEGVVTFCITPQHNYTFAC